MKKQINLLLFACSILIFLACGEIASSDVISDYNEFEESIQADIQKMPAEIAPSNNWIREAAVSQEISWQEVDNWCDVELSNFKDQPYFNDLKAMIIQTLVKKPGFAEEINMERLKYYAQLETEMNTPGGLERAADLFRILEQRGESQLAAQLAADKLSTVENNYNFVSKTKEEYIEEWRTSYDDLKALAQNLN